MWRELGAQVKGTASASQPDRQGMVLHTGIFAVGLDHHVTDAPPQAHQNTCPGHKD